MSSIIFIGAPGVGKGTQKELFIKKHKSFRPIVPGDIMRNEVANKTEIGMQLKQYLDKGLLAPHDIVMKCVENLLNKYKNEGITDFIFDGFPREIEQAIAINDFLGEKYKIKSVIFFKVDDKIAVERIKGRSIDSGRSDDVDEEVIRTRFREFHQKMAPVVEYYKDLVHFIDASKTPSEVFQNLEQELYSVLNCKK